MSDPPVLAYGRRPTAAARSWVAVALAVVGTVVALVAMAFNAVVLVDVTASTMLVVSSDPVPAAAVATAVAVDAAALWDEVLALALIVIAVQLLRRTPAAVARLRRWSLWCLVGVAGFAATAAGYLVAVSPPHTRAEPLLIAMPTLAVAGCTYPVAALVLTGRRRIG